MFKKIVVASSIFSLLLGSPLVMAQTATSTAITIPIRGIAACMKAANQKKNTAYKAAQGDYKNARKQARDNRDREGFRKASGDFRKAIKMIKEEFAKDQRACVSSLRYEFKKPEVEERSVRIELAALNNSGLKGMAQLKEKDGKVRVEIKLEGAVKNVVQPAHIHSGSCANLGAVKYPLINLEKGKSETVLDTTFEKLKSELPLAVNVHKSIVEAGVYVACGDLKF